jgi:hypothetical protein
VLKRPSGLRLHSVNAPKTREDPRNGHHGAEGKQHSRELTEQLGRVALRGQQLQVDNLEKELAIEHAELEFFHLAHYA